VNAQKNEIYSQEVKTLQVIVNDDWQLPPVIELQSGDYLDISFDELTHEYNRFIYEIKHFNADWSPSSLSEIDYLNGFNNNPIDDYATSINTTMMYTHYNLRIPNDDVDMKVSGNYTVILYKDDSNRQPILKACFSVLDKKVNVSASVSSNTDIDTNVSHQQVSLSINYGGYAINNPQSEVKVQVFQNRRWDNMVTNIAPTYLSAGQIQFSHSRDLIFGGGNEYRKFEITDVRYPSQGIDKISFFRPYYHADLFTDEKRKNYSFDIDQNGKYLVRYSNGSDNNIEADYVFVHFSLALNTPLAKGDIYLQGAFTNDQFSPDYKLIYNPESNLYENAQLVKLGAYNYMYLFVPSGSRNGQTQPIEGDFYETENEYMILVYHRPFGERYDKLIGIQTVVFKQ